MGWLRIVLVLGVCAHTATRAWGTENSPTRLANSIQVKVVATPPIPKTMRRWARVNVTFMRNADIHTVGGRAYSLSDSNIVNIDLSEVRVSQAERKIVVQMERSDICPYEGRLDFGLSWETLKNPPHNLILRVTPIESKSVTFHIIDAATGKPVVQQPIVLMESMSKESMVAVGEANTDADGKCTFKVWVDKHYAIEINIGGPVTEWGQSFEITPAVLTAGQVDWKVKLKPTKSNGRIMGKGQSSPLWDMFDSGWGLAGACAVIVGVWLFIRRERLFRRR